MLLRKQKSFFQTFEATMEFSAQQRGAEAGLLLWWNQFSYATIGVRVGGILSDSGKPQVVCRSPKGRPGEFHVRIPWQRLWYINSDADMFWHRRHRQTSQEVRQRPLKRQCLSSSLSSAKAVHIR